MKQRIVLKQQSNPALLRRQIDVPFRVKKGASDHDVDDLARDDDDFLRGLAFEPFLRKVQEYIAANMIANILGLGSAATPAGLKAMEELAEIKKEKGLPEEVASNEMCTFLILNISSLQLIPVSVIAYRSQYGSNNPSAITGAAIAATLVSTATAVIFCKIKEKMTKDTF